MVLIDEQRFSEIFYQQVLPYLRAIKNEGYFSGKNGEKLYYVNYSHPFNKKAVVICHGFGESISRAAELYYYCIKAGYDVFAYDMRGHGLSRHAVNSDVTVHIDSISDLVCDLGCFITEIAAQKGKELFFLGRALGGLIGALFIEKCPDIFSGAVFSDPWADIEDKFFLSKYTKSVCRFFSRIGKGNKPVKFGKKKMINGENENNKNISVGRIERYRYFQKQNPWLHELTPSFNMLKEILEGSEKVASDFEKIRIPFLIICSDKAYEKLEEKHLKFFDFSPMGLIIPIKDSPGDFVNSTNEIFEYYLNEIFGFFKNLSS